MTDTAPHRWRFFRAGGLDQVRLETADDLRNLGKLDQKLWVALACPVTGLEFDEATLRLIDTDLDGRVRVPEVVAAVAWACGVLKDPAILLAGGPHLPLAAIDDSVEANRSILAAARRIVAARTAPGPADAVTVAEAGDSARVVHDALRNGDGVVTAEAATDAAVKALIAEAVACGFSTTDRSGGPGVDGQRLDAFLKACADHLAWSAGGAAVAFLGEGTAAAVAAISVVRAKIDDWFARSRLAAFDPRAIEAANGQVGDYGALLKADLDARASVLAGLPLRRVEASSAPVLDLGDGINPAWVAPIDALRRAALPAGTIRLDEPAWRDLLVRADAWSTWFAADAGKAVAGLGAARLQAIAADAQAVAALRALIADDLAAAAEVAAVAAVERIARYHRDLGVLLRNFTSFSDFYDPRKPAVFQSGSLYLDSRRFDLVLRVADPGAHAGLAQPSACFLLYMRCTRTGQPPTTIVTAATQGDGDYLRTGRNGIWYDRQGRDWDASVVKVVEAPVSIREAFWSPYKKLGRLIEEQVVKRIGGANAEADARIGAAASAVATADQKPAAPPKKEIDVGTVAAIGVAMGAIGTAVGSVIGGILGLGPWLPLGLVAVIMAISGPSMLIAAFKLRGRSLGPILEASGWAINGRVKINIPLGTVLTAARQLPPGSARSLVDPFEDKDAAIRRRQIVLVVILTALAVAAWFLWRHGDGAPAAAKSGVERM